MKSLIALFAIGLLSIGAAACGGAAKGTSSASRISSSTGTGSRTSAAATKPVQDFTKADGDKDNDVGAPYDDTNNNRVLSFGHAASASDRQTIAALVERYYAASAAEDGAKACSMLYSTITETVPEDYGTSPPGPSYAKGTTCPAVLTLIFKHSHDQLAVKLSKLKVSRVRLEEHHGLAVLSFGKMPEREIQVIREGRTWKIQSLLDRELP